MESKSPKTLKEKTGEIVVEKEVEDQEAAPNDPPSASEPAGHGGIVEVLWRYCGTVCCNN